jgi:hypothetical protein
VTASRVEPPFKILSAVPRPIPANTFADANVLIANLYEDLLDLDPLDLSKTDPCAAAIFNGVGNQVVESFGATAMHDFCSFSGVDKATYWR